MSERFGRAIFIVNPKSTLADSPDVRGRMDNVRGAFGRNAILQIETERKPALFAEKLHGILRVGDLAVPVCGDGGINQIVAALVEPELAELETTVLSIGGGNGNLLTEALNGKASKIEPAKIIQDGEVVAVAPISWTQKDPGQRKRSLVAATCAGIGVSAETCLRLGRPEHRELPGYKKSPSLRFAYDGLTVVRSVFASATFEMERDGHSERRADISWTNSQCLAKSRKLPVKLTDPRILVIEMENRHPDTVIKTLGQTATGRVPRNYIEQGDVMEFTVRTESDRLRAHVDAEAHPVFDGTQIAVQAHDTPFYALSTRGQSL